MRKASIKEVINGNDDENYVTPRALKKVVENSPTGSDMIVSKVPKDITVVTQAAWQNAVVPYTVNHYNSNINLFETEGNGIRIKKGVKTVKATANAQISYWGFGNYAECGIELRKNGTVVGTFSYNHFGAAKYVPNGNGLIILDVEEGDFIDCIVIFNMAVNLPLFDSSFLSLEVVRYS